MNVMSLGWAILLTLAVTLTSAATAEVLVGVPLADNPDTSEYDKHIQVSAELAAADLNAKGGVLGEQVRLIFANDECKPEPAVAVAEKLVEQGVAFVDGHLCSGAGLAAWKVYEQAGVLMITGTAASPKLTDEGGANVFRICGRSDQEGQMAASYLAEQWGEKDIAILHDGSTYGQGVAEFTKAYLNRMGEQEALFERRQASTSSTSAVTLQKSAGSFARPKREAMSRSWSQGKAWGWTPPSGKSRGRRRTARWSLRLAIRDKLPKRPK
jgi:branched-chain amino acid transport system substrate-binding protein